MKRVTLHLRDGGTIEVAAKDVQHIEPIRSGSVIEATVNGKAGTYHVYEAPSRIKAMLAQ